MRRKPPGLDAPTAPVPRPDERGVDFGWRTHNAITDWTARVDSKASIVLGLGGVLLGLFVTLTGNHRLLTHLSGWRQVVDEIGLAVTALGVLLTALVVAPRLNRKRTKNTWQANFLYFGHLRRWDATALRGKLHSLSVEDELDVLSRQLVETSEIAWRKHSILQGAMFLLILGALLVLLAVAYYHAPPRMHA